MNSAQAKKKVERKRSVHIFLIVLSLTLLLIPVAVCYYQFGIAGAQLQSWSFDNSDCNSDHTNFSMESLEETLGVEFPASTTNLWSQCTLWEESTVEAKFELHPDDLEAFITTTNISLPLSPTDSLPSSSFFSILHSPFEDEIRQLDTLLYGTAGSERWQEDIVVDIRNADRWTVYFMVWTD